ncbi:predicted membrane protein [Lachnospiraceae bacterium KM106-2]|nr:predicted membrane protein [Lachnospiraceae bacterium KM106-2]
MENFKRKLKVRMGVAWSYNIMVLLLLGLGVFDLATNTKSKQTNLVSAFNMGVCIGIQFVMIYFMGKYIAAMKSEEKLKELYIEETDERRLFIQAKIGGTAMNVVMAGLLLGAMVSGYFNIMIFYGLFGATIFTILVKLVMKVYYTRNC